MAGGAMVDRQWSANSGVDFNVLVMTLQALFHSAPIFLAWHECDNSGEQYSAAE